MIIALPVKEGKINRHFGKSLNFAIVEIADKQIKAIRELNTMNLVHEHEHLASLLKQQGVDLVIAGGMGLGAFIALKSKEIEVIGEIAGSVEEVVEAYLAGRIEEYRETKCDCSKGDCINDCSTC